MDKILKLGDGIIKRTSRKLFILGIMFFLIMGISGVYAGAAQIMGGQQDKNGVNIKIHIFSLNSENIEEEYEKNSKEVMPAEVISFIPKIENLGMKCYVRAKIMFINQDIDAATYIEGISDEWEKHGEYYYLKNPLDSEKMARLFSTIKIPQYIRKITSSKNIKLEITAEAIQEENFKPDYTKDNPWHGVDPTQSVNTEYNIDTNDDENITINNEENSSCDSDKRNAQTGDKINVAITIFVISSIALVIVLILDYREKINFE